MREISNREYHDIERERIGELAARIKGAGVSYSCVAKGTRLGYNTIRRAAAGEPVRSDAMIRIDYYLSMLKRSQLKEMQ